VDYFPWNLFLTQIIKNTSTQNHMWCFERGSMHVWNYRVSYQFSSTMIFGLSSNNQVCMINNVWVVANSMRGPIYSIFAQSHQFSDTPVYNAQICSNSSVSSSTIYYYLLLITTQAAQLICLGCTINNIGVQVTINRSAKLHYIIMCYLCMLQLLIGKKKT